MTISIITPVFNGGATIARTITALLDQGVPFQYVLVDSCSTDNTLELVRSFEQDFIRSGIDHLIVSEPDEGIYDGMNKGIELATGDIIGIINADDCYETGALRAVLRKFEEEKDVQVVHGNTTWVFPGGKSQIRKAPIGNLEFTKGMVINHPSTFVKKELYAKIGMYSTSYRIVSDWDFFIRCEKARAKFVALDKNLTLFSLNGISNMPSFLHEKERHKVRRTYRFYMLVDLKYLIGLVVCLLRKTKRVISGI